jgi:hypothetical protein
MTPIISPKIVSGWWEYLGLNYPVADYSASEIHGVRDVTAGEDAGTIEPCGDAEADYFSVYLHLKEGGVDCIANFDDKTDADAYAQQWREFLK